MRSTILIVFCCIMAELHAQEPINQAYADSVTYQAYLVGDWDRLIELGKKAQQQGIDFKFLEQRMGYAYYLKANYYASMRHYEKALIYDSNDQTSLLYLYYNGLETGNAAYARYYAGKLSPVMQASNHQKAIKPIRSLDYEFSHSWNKELNRTNPTYQRIGIGTDLGYSFSLYQTYSKFNQKADYSDSYNQYRSAITQEEYYLLAGKSFSADFGLDLGYHSIKTTFNTDVWDLTLQEQTDTYDPLVYKGYLWFAGLHYKWNRLHLSASTSYMDLSYNTVYQQGLQVGVALPGKQQLYLSNAVYLLADDNDQWLISKHTIGMLFFKKYWMELSKTFGNQNNFVDANGLYVYNSFDPTLSKTGLSLFWYCNAHLTLYGNLSLETKQNSFLLTNYQQNALTGGIIWKF